jgi:hypothetical protein
MAMFVGANWLGQQPGGGHKAVLIDIPKTA